MEIGVARFYSHPHTLTFTAETLAEYRGVAITRSFRKADTAQTRLYREWKTNRQTGRCYAYEGLKEAGCRAGGIGGGMKRQSRRAHVA